MWIVPTLVGFMILAWLGYAWMSALFVKYQHTLESAAVMVAIAVGSLYSGWGIALSIAPGWSAGPKAAIALAVGFTLFSLFTFLAVSLWTALLVRRFDEQTAALDEEEDRILRRLQAMRWDSYRSEAQGMEAAPSEEAPLPDPREDLRKTIETWEQGGGAARIRSLKVLEWREEASAKTTDEIKEDIRSLEIEAAMESDEAKKEQTRVRLAVARLVLMEKEPTVPDRPARRAPKPEIKADEAAMRQRLQEIHRELQAVKNAKAQYLRSRVKLGWRSDR